MSIKELFWSDRRIIGVPEAQYSEAARDIIDILGYPHKVFAERSRYCDVMRAYRKSLKRGEKDGFTPVLLVVDPNYIDFLAELLRECFVEKHHTVEELLNIEYDKHETKSMLWNSIRECTEGDEEIEQYFHEKYRRWVKPYTKYRSMIGYKGKRTYEIILFEIPTKNPWELVAYIPFEYGGWNGIPDQTEMLQICRYFYEEYQAVPVVITPSTLEMSIPKRLPQNKVNEATMEHWIFAPETGNMEIFQKRQKINAVSKKWYFWWD